MCVIECDLCVCVYIWFHIFFVSFYEGVPVYVCLVRFSSVRMFFLLFINVNLCGSILILAWAFLSPLVWKIIARNIRSVRVPVSLHTNPDQHWKRDQLLQIKGQSARFLACASSINIMIGSTQTPANANRPIIASLVRQSSHASYFSVHSDIRLYTSFTNAPI